ncbi:unnamed protein product [Phytophthora lilii]|uniref:Unnamed protein product n=1 Tax=Phytophthora lilii TaxID=2077276 RepID=A0A9W6U6L6_9STRA|nr:unnamed protein product [Phytophthora lilii]
MRFNYIPLLITVYLHATSDAAEIASARIVADDSTLRLLATKLLDVPPRRVLRYIDENGEERAGVLPVSVVEKARTFLTSSDISPETLARWLKNKKPIDKAFQRMGLLDEASETIFKNKKFLEWLNYADELSAKLGKDTSPVAALTAHYGDETLSRIILAAKRVPDTEDIATKLQTQQIQFWLKNDKSPGDVFMFLELTKAGDKILSNPQFITWLNYADNLTSKYGKETWPIATLTDYYSDLPLLKMLNAAKQVPETESIATRLLAEQVQNWLKIKRSPDAIFKVYELNKLGDKVLTSPQLAIWKNYLQAFNKENPTKKTSLISAISTSYGDDGAYKILQAAKQVAETKSTAKKLEIEQVQYWLKNEKSPEEVFKLTVFGRTGDDLLSSPELSSWTKYLKLFNNEYSDKSTTLIATLSKVYGDEGLIKMLAAAKKVPTTSRMAANLEKAQVQYWLDTRKSTDDVFTLLKLDKGGDDLFRNPLFTNWIKYVDDYHSIYLEEKASLIRVLKKHYTNAVLARMIIDGTLLPSTKHTAQRLQAELFKSWMGVRRPFVKTPDDVFALLKLGKAGDQVFRSSMFTFWTKYLDDYNIANPDRKTSVISALSVSHSDEAVFKFLESAKKIPSTEKLATKLQAEQLEYFLKKRKSPEDVAVVLNVQDKTDANWQKWKNYQRKKRPTEITWSVGSDFRHFTPPASISFKPATDERCIGICGIHFLNEGSISVKPSAHREWDIAAQPVMATVELAVQAVRASTTNDR